jgi:tetratricopeptide (TPR) repeat protein
VIGVATLGLLVGAAGRRERAGAGATEHTERALRLGPRVAVGLVAAALIALQLVPLLSENEIRVSQEAAARGDGKRALEAAQAARRLEPWASSPYLQVALVREQTGDLTGAGSAIAAAIDRDRFNWRLWLVSARLETRAGRIPAARASLRRAHALNPKSPLWQRS